VLISSGVAAKGEQLMGTLKSASRASRVAMVVVVLVASWTAGDAASTRRDLRSVSGEPRSTGLDLANRERVRAAYSNLPLAFVENRGQTDSRARFLAQGSRFTLHLTPDAAMLSLVETGNARGATLALRFLGANKGVVVSGGDRAPGEVSYFHGSDPSRWRTGIARFTDVRYRDLWRGVDMVVRGDSGALKYEFHVQPGARVSDIRLAYEGVNGLALDATGQLLIQTAVGELRDSAPVAYQERDGVRVPIGSRFALQPAKGRGREYGFVVSPDYDRARELVIDPGLDYSTFLGGASHESANSVAVDASGNAYITGITQSPDFPTTAGAFDRTGAASNSLEAFVTKLNPTGTALVYSTFLGGSNFEWGRAIAIDAAGNAYIAGQTKSSDFPTTGGAFDQTFNVDTCPRCGIDQYDAFVTKLNASGSALVYSTFLGGFDIDDALAIAVDGAGNAYVGGETGSLNFPVTAGAFDTTPNGAYDAFVTKLNAAGSALLYSTYLGGLEVEFPADVAVDASGVAYVTGVTRSADFPTTPGAYDTTHNGLFDVFVTAINPSGSGLVFSTFIGGSDFDSVGGLALDVDRNVYVAGGTSSLNYPTTAGAYDRTTDGSDATVTKLSSDGSTLIYSTFVGGTGSDGAADVIVDGAGNAWIAGGTGSADFPTTPGTAFDTTISGGGDAFLAELNAAGSSLLFGTFFGGNSSDGASDLAFDPGGNIIIVGQTMSPDFPTTAGAPDRTFNGDPLIFWADAFVAKFAMGTPLPPPPPSPPAAPTLLAPANGATPAQPVAFDWSDVSGAVSYDIQVDDSSAFSAPLVVQQSVTLSQFSTGGFASVQHWWRVRGVNSSGGAGAWSAVRTFTPQAASPPPPPPSGLPAPTLVSPANDARFPPGSTITFDWSDVSGAAGYTIQIDDSSTFTAPLTVNQTTTASQFTTSSLPTTRMWWRVRANDSSGAPGAWSSARRFELRN
jgi:hypothetical protein